MDFAQILKDFGPLAGVIIFFIWRDWRREEDLVDRVRTLEKYNQETLVNLVRESITVIAANTQQMKWVTMLIQSCHSGRPIVPQEEKDG